MPPNPGSSAGNRGSRGGEQLLSATFAVWQLLLCQHRIMSLTVQINQEEKSKQLSKDRAQSDSPFHKDPICSQMCSMSW